jgi:hypothetical protein
MALFSDTDYWLTRFVFQRSLACIYLIGFSVAVNQFLPLCGEKGLTPAQLFLKEVKFWDAPSIFWIDSSDRAFLAAAWIGVVLSLMAVSGLSDALGVWVSLLVWALLWLLYLSFVNVGQIWYSFGWETLLLEAGFLTIFLGPGGAKVPVVIVWLLRWLLFRLMFGAGLIKMRGDQCWRDLTCMMYHYETQPMPNPLSWYFHQLPPWFLKSAVLFNHFTELIVPFGYFFPGRVGAAAGAITIVFQLLLIISGNFSWLNWLTIVLCIACFGDRYFAWLPLKALSPLHDYVALRAAVYPLTVVVLILSIKPALNLLARRQMMNASFEPLHLVNTYGAFGSITKTRYEVAVEGTMDPKAETGWLEYRFKGKPGEIDRTPPIIAPYHLRLDWLMWFAPFGPCDSSPWLLTFMEKLLEDDKPVLSLLRLNPFADKPPRFVRASLYEYHFTTPEEKAETGAIWRRSYVGLFCPLMGEQPPITDGGDAQ